MTNPNIIKMSKLYAPTLKEDPADAEIASHRLLLRAGFIRKTASGVYTFLPLGQKVLSKVENIVREEMDAIGAQEIMMPALQPAELWHESGRWDAYGPELMRLNDRHDHEFCLGPTHEELIVALVRNELRSYKELPVSLYQIQVKFRDEIRPRFGLLRSREFMMKDAYSFNESYESMQKTYDDMSEAYGKICDRAGLDYRPVEADGGQIGGSVTCEFMALAEAGEAELVHCTCGYAANTEAGECIAHPTVYDVPFEKVATPGVHTIAELAEFLDIPESSTVKALSGKNDEGKMRWRRLGCTKAQWVRLVCLRMLTLLLIEALKQFRNGWLALTKTVSTMWVLVWAKISRLTSGMTCRWFALAIAARSADSRWRVRAALKLRRCSSLATSTQKPWAQPLWMKTAKSSRSLWAAMALVFLVRLQLLLSNTMTNSASRGRCRWRRRTCA